MLRSHFPVVGAYKKTHRVANAIDDPFPLPPHSSHTTLKPHPNPNNPTPTPTPTLPLTPPHLPAARVHDHPLSCQPHHRPEQPTDQWQRHEVQLRGLGCRSGGWVGGLCGRACCARGVGGGWKERGCGLYGGVCARGWSNFGGCG